MSTKSDTPIGGWVYGVLTVEHVALFRRASVDWNDCETGAPCIDPKRPYGNSDVEGDVCEILGWAMEGDDGDGPCWSSKQRKRASTIHQGTQDALQMVLNAGSLEPGRYRKGRYGGRWERCPVDSREVIP